VIAVLVAIPGVALAGGNPVWVTGNCTSESYKPQQIILNCGDTGRLLRSLHWGQWSTTKATGTGILYVKRCAPNCASHGYTKYNVIRVTLSKPGKCYKQSHLAFKRASVLYRSKHGTKSLTVKLFCPIPKSNGGP
jgi:hypothetical protein